MQINGDADQWRCRSMAMQINGDADQYQYQRRSDIIRRLNLFSTDPA
jgi:hypothetical protein